MQQSPKPAVTSTPTAQHAPSPQLLEVRSPDRHILETSLEEGEIREDEEAASNRLVFSIMMSWIKIFFVAFCRKSLKVHKISSTIKY